MKKIMRKESKESGVLSDTYSISQTTCAQVMHMIVS